MTSFSRIMLLEPNRYRAVLIQRMIEQDNLYTIIARYSDPDQALDELTCNGYDAAIINADSLSGQWLDFCEAASRKNPGIYFVVLASDNVPQSASATLQKFFRYSLVKFADAAQLISGLHVLPELLPDHHDRQLVRGSSSRHTGMALASQ